MEDVLRYARNLGFITPQEQEQLHSRKVCVAGCGGLGGFLLEYLGRMGVGYITAVDGDRFEATNLNRQLLATQDNLGQSKAVEAKKHLARINPDVQVTAVEQFLTAENAAEILAGHNLVLDALDSIPHRLMLQRICRELQIPLIHGAVEGWFGQVTTVLPGDDSLSRLYHGATEASAPESSVGTLAFAPALVAALQAGEAVKLLLDRDPALREKVLFADILQNRFDCMPI